MKFIIDIPDHLYHQAQYAGDYIFNRQTAAKLFREELGAAAGHHSGNTGEEWKYELLRLFRLKGVKVKGI